MEKQRRAQQMHVLFLSTMLALALCVVLVGVLYIVKNSPEHKFVVLRDRNAPLVVVRNQISKNGQQYEIHDFVDSVQDISKVTMSYVNAPDYSSDGTQKVVIRFTDEAGHYTDKTIDLEVYHDTSAPVIYIDDDIWTYWNEPISYKSLVELEDDNDAPEDITLEIDNNEVDITKIGDYQVTYTAYDTTGNSTTKLVTFHIMEPDTDEYYLYKANELCDSIIASIITPDMDDLHKVWAVYEYVSNITYIYTDYTRNYIREGYKMLSNLYGDCYGSYAAVRLLLDRLDIMNQPIQTDENYTTHFWNLVSLDGGVTWYHVDATNWIEWAYKPPMCMISDTRLDAISEKHRGTHYRDTSLYPSTPYESMAIPQDVIQQYNINTNLLY